MALKALRASRIHYIYAHIDERRAGILSGFGLFSGSEYAWCVCVWVAIYIGSGMCIYRARAISNARISRRRRQNDTITHGTEDLRAPRAQHASYTYTLRIYFYIWMRNIIFIDATRRIISKSALLNYATRAACVSNLNWARRDGTKIYI